jgi:hypothetical protein
MPKLKLFSKLQAMVNNWSIILLKIVSRLHQILSLLFPISATNAMSEGLQFCEITVTLITKYFYLKNDSSLKHREKLPIKHISQYETMYLNTKHTERITKILKTI